MATSIERLSMVELICKWQVGANSRILHQQGKGQRRPKRFYRQYVLAGTGWMGANTG